MFTKTKMNSRLGYDSTARFIFDIFMFWTVMTGIACDSSNQNQSHELKIFNGKRSDNPEYLYQVGVPRSNNYAGHNGNALATVIFDKMLHWIFDEEIEKGKSCRMSEARGKTRHALSKVKKFSQICSSQC